MDNSPENQCVQAGASGTILGDGSYDHLKFWRHLPTDVILLARSARIVPYMRCLIRRHTKTANMGIVSALLNKSGKSVRDG